MAESLADDAKVEDVDRGRLRKTLKQLRKQKDQEKEGCALLEALHHNVDEAHVRASETEQWLHLGARGVHVLVGPRIWKITGRQ